YDYGPERVSWMGHLMTNWAGDDGFLQELNVEIRRHNIVGDTTWCRGKVAAKEVSEGQHRVRCQVWAENQRGETTVTGTAVVALPTRV
ncbi:MAG: hypothetical protein Q8N53_02030, partial [Longimicrobiales bacterium]|nr:hypothetical protein [Longimicrobiales bacterium]